MELEDKMSLEFGNDQSSTEIEDVELEEEEEEEEEELEPDIFCISVHMFVKRREKKRVH